MLRNSRTLILAVGSLALLLLSVACQNRAEVSNEGQGTANEQLEGEEFTFGGYLLPSDNLGNSLKSKEDDDKAELNNIQSLRILVFDNQYHFQYSADAILTHQPINVSGETDDKFLPDKHRGEVDWAYSYKVTLKKSQEPRILHFVTDADWTGIANDQMLEGSSAGAILPRLTTDKTDPMWCEIRVDKLDDQILKDKVVKMVRNYAVVKIKYQADANEFTPLGYYIYNVPDKSSVVPYTIDPNTFKISFPTPFTEMQRPTVPANMQLTPGDQIFKSIDERTTLFESDNDSFYRDKTFIILKGRYQGDTEDRFFKLDFVSKLSEDNPTADYIPIMRNHEYTFVINEVNSEGYPTEDEAINGVANNNLLMSVNTRYISAFKYGDYELTINPIATMMVKEGNTKQFDLSISGNAEIVKVIPSWNGEDEYLEPIEVDSNRTYFKVTQKKVPSSHLRTYFVDVVAKTKPASGGKPEFFTRRAYIYLSEPIKITTRLERKEDVEFGNAYRGSYWYIIEQNEQLPEGILPIHFTIKTKNLTYYKESRGLGNEGDELLPLYINIDRKTGTQSYRGTLTDKNSKKRLIAIFTSNSVDIQGFSHDVSVELSSPIHETTTVQLP